MYRVDGQMVGVLNLYENSRAAVHINGPYTDWLAITRSMDHAPEIRMSSVSSAVQLIRGQLFAELEIF